MADNIDYKIRHSPAVVNVARHNDFRVKLLLIDGSSRAFFAMAAAGPGLTPPNENDILGALRKTIAESVP